jgi:hypothetical protein
VEVRCEGNDRVLAGAKELIANHMRMRSWKRKPTIAIAAGVTFFVLIAIFPGIDERCSPAAFAG